MHANPNIDSSWWCLGLASNLHVGVGFHQFVALVKEMKLQSAPIERVFILRSWRQTQLSNSIENIYMNAYIYMNEINISIGVI